MLCNHVSETISSTKPREMMGCAPEACEQNSEDNCKHPNRPVLGLNEDLPETVYECSNPQKPFENGCQHHQPDDRRVDDLCWTVSDQNVERHVFPDKTHVFGRPRELLVRRHFGGSDALPSV